MKESIILPPDAMESGIKVRPPQGCEVDEIKVVDGFLTVTFREKERKLPKSWEEFCKMFHVPFAFRPKCDPLDGMRVTTQVNIPSVMADFTEDPELSDALVALIKLILLRNAYNGDWMPDWDDYHQTKYVINFVEKGIVIGDRTTCCELLYFENRELRDEFLKCFRPLIEKLKPLYGVKEGGEAC